MLFETRSVYHSLVSFLSTSSHFVFNWSTASIAIFRWISIYLENISSCSFLSFMPRFRRGISVDFAVDQYICAGWWIRGKTGDGSVQLLNARKKIRLHGKVGKISRSVFNPNGINNNGHVELPSASDPDAVQSDNEYSRAQVLKHTITHEICHVLQNQGVNWTEWDLIK